MSLNKLKIKNIVIGLLLLLTTISFAQSADTAYSVNAFAGVGYNRFISDLDYDGLNKNGYSATIRFMWQPEHLLSIGIESGYIQLHSSEVNDIDDIYGTEKLETNLSAVPILAIYTMRITDNINLSAGVGGYMLTSKVSSHGNNVFSTEWTIGYLISASYLVPVANKINIGGEIKWDYINKIADGSLLFQFVLKYSLLEY